MQIEKIQVQNSFKISLPHGHNIDDLKIRIEKYITLRSTAHQIYLIASYELIIG